MCVENRLSRHPHQPLHTFADLVFLLIFCRDQAAAGLLPASVAPTFTWIFSMAYLSWGHIDRMSLDDKYWSLEFTMFQMVMTAKQIMFVCNIADGAVLKAEAKTAAEGGKSAISPFQKQRALTVMPSPLEYMSYMFFFGGLIVGPAFEMREYLDFTEETVFRKVPSPPLVHVLFRAHVRFALCCFISFWSCCKFSSSTDPSFRIHCIARFSPPPPPPPG